MDNKLGLIQVIQREVKQEILHIRTIIVFVKNNNYFGKIKDKALTKLKSQQNRMELAPFYACQ